MDLPHASPARCELHAVISFFSVNHAKSIGHSVWMSKTCESRSESSCTDVHDEQLSGRPSVLAKDRCVTVDELCEWIPEVSKSTFDKILTKRLHYRNMCARWVPKMIIDDHKWQSVEAACRFMECYAE